MPMDAISCIDNFVPAGVRIYPNLKLHVLVLFISMDLSSDFVCRAVEVLRR